MLLGLIKLTQCIFLLSTLTRMFIHDLKKKRITSRFISIFHSFKFGIMRSLFQRSFDTLSSEDN